MLDDFLIRGLLGGLGVAVIAGPLGCFVVWRRMAYFGASIAHAALLGVALGFFFEADPFLGIVAVCITFAAGIALLQRQTRLATDTLLGILAHVALALGIIAVSLMERLRVDLMSYLFGDILSVGRGDLVWIYGGAVVVMAVLAWIWRPMLAITVHQEMAEAEGINVTAVRLVFTLLLATVIAFAMKIVGILLIISLLVIPAAAARVFSRTPEQMAVIAAGVGMLSVAGGLGASAGWDTPSGPSIVVVAFLIFMAGQIYAHVR